MIKLSGGLLDQLRRTISGVEGLEFAALFGSLVAKGQSYHDVDIVVKASGEDKYSLFCKLIDSLSRTLGVGEEQIDLVDLDRANLAIKGEIVKSGIVLVDRSDYKRRLIGELDAKYIEYDEIQNLSIREWLNARNPGKINLKIIKRRIDFIKNELQFLRGNVLNYDLESVKGSPILQRLMERSFHLIVETMLDVCRHIISIMGWGPALSYSDIVEICFKHGAIDDGLRAKILNGVRLRNIIIHRYLEVDYEKLYEKSRELETVVGEFELQILRLIRKASAKDKSCWL